MPLPTSARLYTGQLRTRYLKMKADLRISRFYRDEASLENGLCNNALPDDFDGGDFRILIREGSRVVFSGNISVATPETAHARR